ncbi:hypothetical protein GWI33_011530 [Rhynchophorus ferrugineus]|uniref:Uncharacterized protein n=1 Tax=Rhynchophorus ferrugineus TaxID=354439 RepID=A0A834IPZ6_RHYFE|nr:hypothetical protein GWI33_011530 [Rhynchophorus ferrugineus]
MPSLSTNHDGSDIHQQNSWILRDVKDDGNNISVRKLNDFLDFDSDSKQNNNQPIIFTVPRKLKITKAVNRKNVTGVANHKRRKVQKTRRVTTKPKIQNKVSSLRPDKHSTIPNRKIITKKPSVFKRIKVTTQKPRIVTQKPHKLSTFAPIKIILTKHTTAKPVNSTPKYYGDITTYKPTTTKIKVTKPKPTVLQNLSTESALKQNWYEEGVPYPNPMPEISSISPPFSIDDTSSSILETSFDNVVPENPLVGNINAEISTNSPSAILQGVPPILPLVAEDAVETVPTSENSIPNAVNNAISTFNLDLVPSDVNRDTIGGGCPTVHISSSVLGPQQRQQECSDLNLVLNTHFHQNQNLPNDRVPQISTYESESLPIEAADSVEILADEGVLADEVIPEEDLIGETVVADDLANSGVVDPVVDDLANSGIAADPGTVSAVEAPAVSGGSPGAGGTGGSGGGPGFNPLSNFKFPELKPIFKALGYLGRGIGWLAQRLANPWLYIVPIVLFFVVGFKSIMLLFPWWIPFVFLYFSAKSEEPKPTITHVNHKHKPVIVKHHDNWFWDEQTNSWKSVVRRKRSIDSYDILNMLSKFERKIATDNR